MMKKLYLLVSKDKYELPLAVMDSIPELSKIVGRTENSVRSSVTHYYNDGLWCPFRRVEVEWEDGET